MERSYDEIMKILKLAGSEELSKVTYKGSRTYLPDEKTPVESEAARYLAKLADEYSPENPLADFLAKNTIEEAESYAKGKAWTRVIWDVTAIAWLLSDNDRFMLSRVINTHIPNYETSIILQTAIAI